MYQFVLYSEVPLSTYLFIAIYMYLHCFRENNKDMVEYLFIAISLANDVGESPA